MLRIRMNTYKMSQEKVYLSINNHQFENLIFCRIDILHDMTYLLDQWSNWLAHFVWATNPTRSAIELDTSWLKTEQAERGFLLISSERGFLHIFRAANVPQKDYNNMYVKREFFVEKGWTEETQSSWVMAFEECARSGTLLDTHER